MWGQFTASALGSPLATCYNAPNNDHSQQSHCLGTQRSRQKQKKNEQRKWWENSTAGRSPLDWSQKLCHSILWRCRKRSLLEATKASIQTTWNGKIRAFRPLCVDFRHFPLGFHLALLFRPVERVSGCPPSWCGSFSAGLKQLKVKYNITDRNQCSYSVLTGFCVGGWIVVQLTRTGCPISRWGCDVERVAATQYRPRIIKPETRANKALQGTVWMQFEWWTVMGITSGTHSANDPGRW